MLRRQFWGSFSSIVCRGAAYETLRKSGLLGAVSREFRNALKGAWEQNCQRNESFYTAVKLLSELLAGKEGKYAMLKGAVLCGKYPNGCRTSNDIDLLLLPEHITELGDVLEAAGFRQGRLKAVRLFRRQDGRSLPRV